MPILLKNDDLRDIFERLGKNSKDQKTITDLLNLLKPVIKLTIEKFKKNLTEATIEDLTQEINLSVIKKIDYLTGAYLTGKVKNFTNYLFQMLKNCAIAYRQKERKQSERMVSVEDIKVDSILTRKDILRSKAIMKVRREVFEWLEARYPEKKHYKRAAKYIDMILSGKRPSFKTKVIKKMIGGLQETAKEAYSVVLQRIREAIINNAEDFGLVVNED